MKLIALIVLTLFAAPLGALELDPDKNADSAVLGILATEITGEGPPPDPGCTSRPWPTKEGVVVVGTREDWPAQNRVREHDLIYQIGDTKITTVEGLLEFEASLKPGDRVEIFMYRIVTHNKVHRFIKTSDLIIVRSYGELVSSQMKGDRVPTSDTWFYAPYGTPPMTEANDLSLLVCKTEDAVRPMIEIRTSDTGWLFAESYELVVDRQTFPLKPDEVQRSVINLRCVEVAGFFLDKEPHAELLAALQRAKFVRVHYFGKKGAREETLTQPELERIRLAFEFLRIKQADARIDHSTKRPASPAEDIGF